MSDSARDLLTRGIAAAKSDEPEQARKYLHWSLRNRPDPRQQVDALYWLARLSEGEEKQSYLEHVLQIEPTHFAARRDLAVLKGEIDESDLVDPIQPELPVQPERIDVEETRFDCAQCGGRMEYDASTRRLRCQYCDYQTRAATALRDGGRVQEMDFIQALATAKGHLHPQSMATFECQACGATYLLEPSSLSMTCAHCGSTHAVEKPGDQQLIPPQGILPFVITQGQAGRCLREWLDDRGIRAIDHFGEIRGLYMPVWTFDISGEAPYTYQRYDGRTWVNESGNELLLYNDLPVAASHRLPKRFADEVYAFDLASMEPYDGSQVAGWPAETYQIPARKAAMAARWHVVEQVRSEIRSKLFGRTKDLHLISADLMISDYRLALLPFWLTSYTYQGTDFQAIINGQTGGVRADEPPRGAANWIRRWLASI
ncbi:MAG: hypothetical protein ACLFWD_12515 [Anaerolineales bacterium]